MNIVDSSGWMEYFIGGENADFFATAIEDTENLVVPVICVYEVFKRILQQQGIDVAELRIADLYKGKLVDLTPPLALSAAQISVELKLPMADSLILAMARDAHATLWTQDEHFKDIPGVEFIAKK
jgi:predicted nucleic acid-binding protein